MTTAGNFEIQPPPDPHVNAGLVLGQLIADILGEIRADLTEIRAQVIALHAKLDGPAGR